MEYDNLCKYLAEKHPDDFASWVLQQPTTDVKILKTELGLEPIRADSVTFLRTRDRILHLEFQFKVPSRKPMPIRMLNYWVRLYWRYKLPITQVLIWLKQTANPAVFENQFQMELTSHGYQVIRMWEQPPEPLLQNSALLPLAVLAAAEDSTQLLNRVAQQVDNIEEVQEQQEISTCTQLLAGLRFNQNLIQSLFREEVMRESVIYQDIIQKGREEGREEGKQEEALRMVMRSLTRLCGTLDSNLQRRIQALSVTQLEDLNEALLDFADATDLEDWLQEYQER